MAPSYRPLLLAVLGFGLANVAAGNSSSTAPASLPSSVPPARTLAPARPARLAADRALSALQASASSRA